MSEKEYIERGALLKTPPFTKFGGDLTWYAEGYLDCAEDARKAVNDAPAADVVEVVRCKDCIYNNGACTHSEIYDDTNYNPDYYCADGKRKEQT